MSYEPTLWVKGDKITAEKLNKAENAIAELSVEQEEKEAQQFMVVRALFKEGEEELATKDGEQVRGLNSMYELDKTWAEIKEAEDEGAFIIGVQKDGLLSSVHVEQFEYDDEEVEYVVSMSQETYVAYSEDEYPCDMQIIPESDPEDPVNEPV